MTKLGEQELLKIFCFLLISFVLSVFKSQPSFATECNTTEINRAVKQLGTLKQRQVDELAKCSSSAVPSLIEALKDSSQSIRLGAINTLGSIGLEAQSSVRPLTQILLNRQNQVEIRSAAAYALGNIRPRDEETVKALLEALRQDSSYEVRAATAYALGQNRATNKEVVLQLLKILDSTDRDSVRRFAARALGEIAEEDRTSVEPFAVSTLIKIIRTQNQDTVILAESVYALGEVGDTSDAVVSILISTLSHSNSEVRIRSSLALSNIAEILYKHANTDEAIEEVVPTLNKIKVALGEDKPGIEPEIRKTQQSVAMTLQNLKNKQKALWNEQLDHWLTDGKSVWLTHAIFWLMLIFAYPKSRQIQAIFFWNPWIRNIIGLGYVSFLLTWVPFLRQKLFAPFKDSLLANAGLDQFNPQAYFPESDVKASGVVDPIEKALPSIQGQLVLEGDSGLGKSMFLRHLVKNSQRIVVYLPAQKCEKGVIEAIQAKLHGQAQDAEFLKNLIYSGAIDICIDGLNEVTADTRAKITQFVESYFKGNIIMTTQPLEWTPPSTAKIYQLQPLRREQIEQFLLSRYNSIAPTPLEKGGDEGISSLLKGGAAAIENCRDQRVSYQQACTDYLVEALNDRQSAEELAAAQRVLSNPMDLTVVAQMLAMGKQPNLFRLQEQQYTLMAAEYRQLWKQDFPLKKFSEAVYQMRLNDENALPADTFYNELLCMEDEKYKMVVSRQWQDAKGEAKKEWYFRHDKIAEFFMVQTFLGKDPAIEERLKTHIHDPRFRGVYFLLATLLPFDAAQRLREDLIQYAADTKDHTVSDTFVQLLRSRTVA